MAKAFQQVAEGWRFVPVADQALDSEDRTTFRLRPLSQAERLRATDDLSRTVIEPDGTQVITTRQRQVARALCLSHIDDVENFPAGAPKPWPMDRAERMAYLEQLDDELVKEIGNEIYNRSAIGAPEKNS
jgi:hypothetical protein